MKKKILLVIIFMLFSLFLMACSNNEAEEKDVEEVDNDQEEQTEDVESVKDESNEDEEQTPSLSETKAIEILNDYRDTFMEAIENTDNEGAIAGYETKADLKAELTTIMSDVLAESFVTHYFEEDNGKIYVVAMDAPVWFDEEQEYSFEQINDTEYEIVQKQSDELVGNVRMTYVITLEEDDWIVSEVRSEQISDDTNNNEQQQPASEEDSGDDGELTDAKAEDIVRKHLNIDQNSEINVVMDHNNEEGDYVVQVYELVSNGETSHTATLGWYIVDKDDGSVEEMM
ncbi:hypothetical protein [Gracilibacillus kekensis]|uniref:Uncharacterized protein n=1 Tax=Gracilibacillus kekensis TaxID=1027249 RepID=A0A1M7PZ10_9BACI|nr:hypothetical protein [Gracilibacillus kekensis]SHN22950.1 hypothetical protein SAMN05216179_2617 [Gracilibacillus kekensis]